MSEGNQFCVENLGRGSTEIFIYTRDVNGIFATVTATLDRLGLTVLDARIISSRSGYTLDSFSVLENSGESIVERRRMKEILDALRDRINCPEGPRFGSSRRPSRVLKHFTTPTEIDFSPDEANNRTMLEIITTDRPGLLSSIGRAFMECGIYLQNAKIVTIGARAEDVFFIVDQDGLPLSDEAAQQNLRDALLAHLEPS